MTNKVAFERERNEAFNLKLRVSEGFHNLGKVVNKTVRWPKLCERFGAPAVDNITLDEYGRLGQAARHSRKNCGWLVGGTFKDGVRRNATIECRSALSYDIDESSGEFFGRLITQPSQHPMLKKYEHLVHTTRSHTPEAPRFRLIIPLKREITPAEFGPISRILGFHIDETMTQIDPVSFRVTQLMFLPSVSSDGVFDWNWHQGKLLDPDVVLRLWERDYAHDYARLPRSPRETGKLREHGKKVGDPRKKRGVIGAWCRAHSITELLDGPWGHLYQPGEATVDGTLRYSYVPGSTSNGVLVYEDTWAYSHHSSDPISSTLVNAWDLERILRFGHLDKHNEEDEWEGHDPRKLPSYKAMLEHAGQDRSTLDELQYEHYDLEAMADGLPSEDDANEEVEAAVTAPTPIDKDWLRKLDVNATGLNKQTLHNVVIILEHDRRFRKAFAYSGFMEKEMTQKEITSPTLGYSTGPVRDKRNGDPLTDAHVDLIRAILVAPHGKGQAGYGLKVSREDVLAAINIVARKNTFHPVCDYLESCEWDGVPRLRKLLTTYWHTPDDEYHAQVGYMFMLAAVTRVFEPGHKWDHVPIFEGRQRIGKSTALEALAGESTGWYGELHINPHHSGPREIVEQFVGKWILELPELAALMDERNSAEALKAIFSGKVDRARKAWARLEHDYARQGIILGTTNNKEYFRDPTGNSRYWPIVVPEGVTVDVAGLRRDRSLLWAEALAEYRWWRRQPAYQNRNIPLPLFLTGQAATYAAQVQEVKMQASDRNGLEGRISSWLNTPVSKTAAKPGWRPDLDAFDAPADNPTVKVLRKRVCIADVRFWVLSDKERVTSRELGSILSHMPGWEKIGASRCGPVLGWQVTWKRVTLK